MERAWIISIGTELTLGQTVDTNGAWLAQRLAALGIRATRHVTAADELNDIAEVVKDAAAATDVVIISGGLGPTADDLTREALAAASGVELELHAPSIAQIEAFFIARGRVMPERNRVQAMVPRGARPIANPCGTAPGIHATIAGTPVFAVPGVPFEMRAMFERDIEPWLRERVGGAVLVSRRLHSLGLGESEVGERIRDLMVRGRNPEVGTTAQLGIIGIRINARASHGAAAVALLDETERDVRARLGVLVYGRDEQSLAGAVGGVLRSAGATVAVAESCTGGLIGKLITDEAGSSDYFLGGVVAYSNAAKQLILDVPAAELISRGAVSGAVAETMARGVRGRFGADYALSVTGIAGPAGGSAEKPIGLVYIALATATGCDVREFHFGADAPREAIRMRAASTALNLLRLALLESTQRPK